VSDNFQDERELYRIHNRTNSYEEATRPSFHKAQKYFKMKTQHFDVGTHMLEELTAGSLATGT
jgi:hypothetical protein